VAEVTSYSLRWIRVIVNRYNQQGEAGVGDGRHHNPGAQGLLDEMHQAQLLQAIATPVNESGLWNGRKVADWMSRVLERPVAPQRGWEYLKQMEFRLRVPRPEPQQQDSVEQVAWKKLPERVEQLRQQYPGSEIQLWAMDEHRLGLKPMLRRVWVPWWENPYAYGGV
jgi:transposase